MCEGTVEFQQELIVGLQEVPLLLLQALHENQGATTLQPRSNLSLTGLAANVHLPQSFVHIWHQSAGAAGIGRVKNPVTSFSNFCESAVRNAAVNRLRYPD